MTDQTNQTPPAPDDDAAARDLAAGNAYWAQQRAAEAARLTAEALEAQAARALTIRIP